MRKIIFLFILFSLLLPVCSSAQNVGINTLGAAPLDVKAMLEVRKTTYSKIKIRTENFGADTAVLELSNRNIGNVGTDMLFSLIGEEGLFISTASDFGSNRKDSLLSLTTSGNLGIGIKTPANTLHLNTPAGTINYMTITNTTTGVRTTDGLLVGMNGNSAIVANLENGNLRLGTNNLTRIMIDPGGNVGIGNLSPGYKLDVNGDINLTGALRSAGSAGVLGEVLVSNGAGLAPDWRETSFGNNTRFGISFSGGSGVLTVSATEYNLNPTDITIGANSITINKSGLYHFNGNYYGWVSSTSSIPTAPEYTTSLIFTGGFNYAHQLELWKVLPTRTATLTYFLRQQFSQDFYITAPTTLQASAGFIYTGVPVFTDAQMNIFGYRISD